MSKDRSAAVSRKARPLDSPSDTWRVGPGNYEAQRQLDDRLIVTDKDSGAGRVESAKQNMFRSETVDKEQ